MEEVVKLIAERTGLPESTVELVVKAVLELLKERLPEPLGTQVERVLHGQEPDIDLGDLAKGLGGLLGG